MRKASNTNIPDAPSGFRAYSREAALQMNVVNEYTYTLEQIVQAGRTKIAITSVPIHTNGELRPSRLFHSMFGYIKKSMLTIIRAYLMYKPLRFFSVLGCVPFAMGMILGIRFLFLLLKGGGQGNIQSLILCSMLILIAGMIWVIGLLADVIAANRKILQELQKRIRKLDYNSEKKSDNK